MKILKHITFLFLMFIRPVAKILFKLIGFFGIIALLGAIIANQMGHSSMIWAILISIFFSFGSFVLGWYYDTILLKLQPENSDLKLFN